MGASMMAKRISLIGLYNKLKQNMDKSSAQAIVETFEQFSGEIFEEIHHNNLATKKDLERFATKEDLEKFATKEDLFSAKIEIDKEVSKAKWQVIGSMLVIFFIPLLLKHWGV